MWKTAAQVLDLQYQGNKAAGRRFIERDTIGRESHEVVAKNIRDQRDTVPTIKYAHGGKQKISLVLDNQNKRNSNQV